MKVNRIIYAVLLIGSGVYAWISGERMLYVAFAVLAALPVVSYVLTYFFLSGLKVSQTVPKTVQKNQTGKLTVRLHNTTPMPFGNVAVLVSGEEFAVEVEEKHTAVLRPLRTTYYDIPFQVLYRGQYKIGLDSVSVTDIVGLFRLQRKFNQHVKIIALPRVVDLSSFPLAMNLMTQAHSRFDIRDEDYATISDIRPYIPTDSIKRVHWKLTAKRSEWLVKVFQSNALNQVAMILDSTRLNLEPKELYSLEDRMVEMSLGLAKFCLSKGMPVDFFATEGFKTKTRFLQEFEIIYQAAAGLQFEQKTSLDCLNILSHVLNDATGYVNVVIFAARLDGELYERVINAANNGHYIAVLYFSPRPPDENSEKFCRLLIEGGTPCFRVSDED
ncbi:MAG: DUF58 domain-containing protein [Defluviitaleaceae bacterium]|nr:DUF58 domain-containing protein [Defluviitaleaceae bacterium]